MSYIPPHKRQMRTTQVQVPAKKYEEQFPELTKLNTPSPTKMNYSVLFKNVQKKYKKKKEVIPYGWVKLTQQGLVNSLSEEQENYEEEMRNEKKKQDNIEQLIQTWDKKREERLEINGYLSDYSVDSFSEQESDDEYIEEEESDYESDNSEYDELFENKKWFTS
jgi:vacuolar-type H+-ATPase subunit I/STV1